MTRSDFGRGGLGIYRALLVRPHVARFLFGGVIVQFPYAMVNMALLIGARDGYGSYSSAGVAAATMSIAGAVIGPNIGRAIDRHGQRRVGSIVGAFWIASIGALAAVLVLDASWLSTEAAGGFTGCLLGAWIPEHPLMAVLRLRGTAHRG